MSLSTPQQVQARLEAEIASLRQQLEGAAEALEQIEVDLGDPDRLPWEQRHLPGVARAALRRARERS